MKPRHYVHMGPKPVEKVSWLWKASHILIFFLLLCSSSIATICVYNLLDMYKFHCITYAKVAFEQSYEERLKQLNETAPEKNETKQARNEELTDALTASTNVTLNCTKDLNATESKEEQSRLTQFLLQFKLDISELGPLPHRGHVFNETMEQSLELQSRKVNNTGFLNMRKTIFATIYMCDLMLFAPLASMIMAIFLGVLTGVAGKGGAGNPGDLLPNPWICVYPFLGLCGFMIIFSFISNNLFHHGLASFCSEYKPITEVSWCSQKMDYFNIQFSPNQMGPPKPFYMTYFVGSIGMRITSALWIIQTVLYVFRILCLADFSLYLTRIRLKGDEKAHDPKMAHVVFGLMKDSKTKLG